MKQQRRRISSIAADRRGAVAVEFAFAMVPLVTILLGGITYSGVLASVLALNHAASEGVRGGIAGATVCERQTRAHDVAQASLIFQPIVDGAVVSASADENEITLEIAYAYTTAPLTPIFLPVPAVLTARMVARTDGPEVSVPAC